MTEHLSRADSVLRECAEIPVDESDPELAAIAVAMFLEEVLELLLPPEVIDPDNLMPPAARAHTVRRLLGEA